MDIKRIEKALKLLDDTERLEALTEAEKETEPQLSIWEKIKTSKHFDFVKKIGLMVALTFLLHLSHVGFESVDFLFSAITLDKLLDASTTAVVFMFSAIVIDIFLYASDTVYYNYIKRNGDRNFDEQESFKTLDHKWKLIISNIKYLGLFYIFSQYM
jgi:hypothetical protein